MSNESQFTPGPWTIRHEFNVFGGDRLVANTGGRGGNVNPEGIRRENLANARLIAAAPELLEALKQCDALLAVTDSLEAMQDQRHPLNAARAAIAKAEGK
jgi:hypothetical protein